MKQQRQSLWQRILERHKYRGRLLRPRVPLVLLRVRRGGHEAERRTALRARVTQYALNLHLHLSWPFVSVQGDTLHETHLHSNFSRNFLWLTPGQPSLHSETSQHTYSSLYNIERGQAPLPDLFFVSALGGMNKSRRGACPRSMLHREISLFRESRGFVLPQTRKLVQLLQQANTTSSLTHISQNVSHAQNVSNESQAINKNIEVQEARKIFAGMVLQHSNLSTHITNRIFSPPTYAERHEEITDTPKISTRPPSSGSTQLKLAAVVEHHRVVKSSKSIASDLTKFHSHRTEHDVLQHTTVFRTQHGNIETPISLLHSTARNAQVLPKERRQATRPDLFLPERFNERTSQEGWLAIAPLYTQPVARNFVTQPARDETGSQSQVRTMPSASPQTNISTQQQPPLDIGRLTDEVYRHIQRKIRVERERRGL
jgi:hypothetical protein